MFTNIAITPMFVTDYDRALDFYTSVLGFEVHTDYDFRQDAHDDSQMRWLTVNLPGEPHREVLLQKPTAPALDPDTAKLVVELTERGATTWMILNTDDVHSTFDKLQEAGVDIVQEPTEQMYGTDMAIRDPFGNQIRITQLPQPA